MTGGADEWSKQWVPVITSSPAFKQDGVLVITFDESDSPRSDSSACCGEGSGPTSALPGIDGLGGGRVGALVLSPFTTGAPRRPRPPHGNLAVAARLRLGVGDRADRQDPGIRFPGPGNDFSEPSTGSRSLPAAVR